MLILPTYKILPQKVKGEIPIIPEQKRERSLMYFHWLTEVTLFMSHVSRTFLQSLHELKQERGALRDTLHNECICI